jgi:hypothetical protein
VETTLAISSPADALIFLPYDVGVIQNGVGNRKAGSLENQGLSHDILAYKQEIHC